MIGIRNSADSSIGIGKDGMEKGKGGREDEKCTRKTNGKGGGGCRRGRLVNWGLWDLGQTRSGDLDAFHKPKAANGRQWPGPGS